MTFDDVRKLALAWPEVLDGTSYGRKNHDRGDRL